MVATTSTASDVQLTSAERSAQSQYWKEHSVSATVESMMLDSQASVIDKQERPEVRQLTCCKLFPFFAPNTLECEQIMELPDLWPLMYGSDHILSVLLVYTFAAPKLRSRRVQGATAAIGAPAAEQTAALECNISVR